MDRKTQIVDYLYSQKERKTSSELMEVLGIPRRSLLRYIKELNESTSDLISSDSSGYLLDANKYNDYLENKNEQEDRIKKIISTLAFAKDSINIYDLAMELYISDSTLQNDLKKARPILSKYLLSLKTEGGFVFIEGSERNKRQLIKSYIYGEVSDGTITLSNMASYFPNYDIDAIRKSIVDTATRHGLFLDDFTLFSIMLHVIVKIERNMYDHHIDEVILTSQQKGEEFYHVSKSICESLEEIMKVSFSESEIYELGLLLAANLHKIDREKESLQYVTEEIYSLAKKMLDYIKVTYELDIDYDSFQQNFSLHIKNLVSRLKNKIEVQNPLKIQLKKMYPFIYEISMDVLNTFISSYGDISEDEVAYITLHLASQIDKNESINNKLHCILISPDFYSLNKKLLVKLKNEFEESIYIDNVYASFAAIDENDDKYDVIISTQPIAKEKIENSIQVSILLPDEDIRRLSIYFEKLLKQKMFKDFTNYLQKYISKDHFVLFDESLNYEEAIHYASNKLYKEGIVSEEFGDLCIEREKISSTYFKDLAIPHPAQSLALKSTIFIMSTKKQFVWTENHKVKLIMLLAIKKEDIRDFKPLFDFVSYYVAGNEVNSLFSEITDYDSFIQNFLNYFSK